MTTSLSDAGLTFADGSVQARAVFPVAIRQTVLSGPVDTNGYAAFGGTTGGTSITATGTLRVTAANGFDALGQVDYVGTITNPTWGSFGTGTYYLYLDINLDGTCTAGSSTVAPVYRWGGADDVTNGRFTFNIQQMVGKVGNGVSAVQARRVYVGETTSVAGLVTSITWYALMGRYNSGFTNTLFSSTSFVSRNHNIGADPAFYVSDFIIKCLTAEAGYSPGDVVTNVTTSNNAFVSPVSILNRRLLTSVSNSLGVFAVAPASGGNIVGVTNANWAYATTTQRGW
jgi:hypothetical protein